MQRKLLFTFRALLMSLCSILALQSYAQIDYQVGTGTTANSGTGVPSPFHDYWDGDRHQFLFRASELQAAGMGAGAILGIKWDVQGLNGQGPIPGYEINIFATSANDLASNWATPIGTPQAVLASGTYTVTTGINSFPFSTPFIWNGTDNIVIQTCHGVAGRCGGFTRNASVNYNAPGFTCSRYRQSDCAGNLCNSTTGSGLTNRPNTIFTYGLPCDDTPFTTIVGPDKICPNRSFDLRPGDYYSGANFLWEFSNDGTTWANYTGSVTVSGQITDNIVAPKWYRLTVTCQSNTNLSYTTPPYKVDIAPFYYCYCQQEPAADTGANLGNLTVINSNQLDTILAKDELFTGTGTPVYGNNNAEETYTPYHDSLQWPCLYRDTNYIYHISQIHSGNTFIEGVLQAYIDYNRDGQYNPNTERLFVKAFDGTGTPPHVIKISATVPSNAQIGPTGLRLVLSADTINGGPCGTFNGAGEVEDYIVEICYEPCSTAVNAGIVVSTDSAMCTGYEYKLTDTTYDRMLSGFNRAWQVSGDNVNWQNIPSSLNKDTLQRVFQGQPLYYRLRTICTPTNDTNYSQATLINDKPGYKCYCYSKAIGGLNVDTSDIGGVTIAGYTSNVGGPHLRNAKAVRPRTDYTDNTPIEMFIDSTYQFSLYHIMPVREHGDAKITVFMDFDNNHEFDIPEERIFTGFTTIGNHTLIDNVVIPKNAITDVPTGLRVIVNNDVGPNIASDEGCGGYMSGETEDYIMVFRKKYPTDINGIGALTGFNVHPNPTTGRFNINFSTNAAVDQVQVRVTNVTGQLVDQQVYEYNGGVFNREMDMGDQPAGVYFVELQANGQRLLQKLVVQ